MIYLFGMKKVRVIYQSYIFQNGHINKINVDEIGYAKEEDNKVTLSFVDTSNNEKVKTTFILEEKDVCIIRGNTILKFGLHEKYLCNYQTEYGSIELETYLKSYLKLGSQVAINYELLMNNESIGKYVVKISYKEMN